ncbi:MAG: hypothetical protein WCJ30_11800, partial [Deltaproteobacteria bacterium]
MSAHNTASAPIQIRSLSGRSFDDLWRIFLEEVLPFVWADDYRISDAEVSFLDAMAQAYGLRLPLRDTSTWSQGVRDVAEEIRRSGPSRPSSNLLRERIDAQCGLILPQHFDAIWQWSTNERRDADFSDWIQRKKQERFATDHPASHPGPREEYPIGELVRQTLRASYSTAPTQPGRPGAPPEDQIPTLKRWAMGSPDTGSQPADDQRTSVPTNPVPAPTSVKDAPPRPPANSTVSAGQVEQRYVDEKRAMSDLVEALALVAAADRNSERLGLIEGARGWARSSWTSVLAQGTP